nr:SpoIIE family protein phosphatase [Streptomyces sp. CC228A]
MERTRPEMRELGAALVTVMQDTGASVGMLYLVPPGRSALRLAVLSGIPLEFAAPWLRVAPGEPIPVADAVSQQRMVWLGDQEAMARHYPRPGLVLPYRFALAALPVSSGTTRWGGLVMMWPGSHPTELSESEAAAVRAGAERMAAVLDRAARAGRPLAPDRPPLVAHPRLPAPDSRQAAAALAFADRLPGGSCALDLDGRIAYVSATAADLLGAPVSRLLGTLPWEELPWLDHPTVEDRYRAAIVSREATAFTAVRPPDHRLRFHLYPDATGISVRITSEAAGDPAAGAEPEERRQEALSVPPPVATGRLGALYHLMHLAATLSEAAGVQDVVRQTAEQMAPALGAQALALLMAEDGRLRLAGGIGCPPELAETLYSIPVTADTPPVRVHTTGTPLFFQGHHELHAAFPHSGLPDLGAWAFLPLVASRRPVGSLVLAYERPRAFASGERAVLSSFAGLVAQAMDRARLYDAKQELARRLQAGLLPHRLPRLPGLDVAARYLPAAVGMGIGGDFYDVIRLGPSTAAVAIGDVQGHNVDAAALMGQVRTAVHAMAGAPPADVLARTNRLLVDLDPGLFTSCLYAELDLAGHRMCLATAGHPPPLCRRPDGTTDTLDVPPGLLLGIDAAAHYTSTETALPPGTVLALYTDGLVETPGTDPDEATGDLADQLSRSTSHDMDGLADALIRHAHRSAPRHDDVALVLLRTSDAPPGTAPVPVEDGSSVPREDGPSVPGEDGSSVPGEDAG